MTREAIRHIVFDIGNVLVHYDPEIPFSRLIPDPNRRRRFLDEVCNSDWNIEQDRGRAWEEAEAEAISRHPDEADNIRAFRTCWHEMVSHAYDENVAILTALLEDGHDITFLTNFAADTFVQAQEMYPFLKAGRGVTVSGRVKLIKPDPAIYETHTERFQLDKGATLFIDDSEKNVEAARAHGWNAIHLPPGKALEPELRAYGIAP